MIQVETAPARTFTPAPAVCHRPADEIRARNLHRVAPSPSSEVPSPCVTRSLSGLLVNTQTSITRSLMENHTGSTGGKCPFPHLHGSASKPTPTLAGGLSDRDWWPNQLEPPHPASATPTCPIRWATDFDYAEEFEKLDLPGPEEGPHRPDDRFAGMVAGRLRPLRAVLHPHGVALPPAPTAPPMAAAAPAPGSSASPRSTAGRTTPTSTRPAACSGRSSRNTASRSPGPTS